MSRRAWLPPLLACALALGCTDPVSVPNPDGLSRPEQRADRSPDGPGARVSRFGFNWAAWTSPPNHVVLTFGVVSPLSESEDCGGTGGVYDGTPLVQWVDTPAGPVHLLFRMKQATMVLYDADVPSVAGPPCVLATAPVVGRGTGDYMATDRDVFVSGPGPDTYGYRIVGTLDLTSGGRAHLEAIGRAIYHPDGSVTTFVDRYALTPIGR